MSPRKTKTQARKRIRQLMLRNTIQCCPSVLLLVRENQAGQQVPGSSQMICRHWGLRVIEHVRGVASLFPTSCCTATSCVNRERSSKPPGSVPLWSYSLGCSHARSEIFFNIVFSWLRKVILIRTNLPRLMHSGLHLDQVWTQRSL